MQFCPCFDQSLLTVEKRAGNQLHGRDSKDGNIVLIIGVKIRWLRKHPNDDSVKARELRHRLKRRMTEWRKQNSRAPFGTRLLLIALASE